MALSLKKLDKILKSKNFMINKIYSMKGLCVFVELIVLNNGIMVLLYIPSKYDIKVIDSFYDINYKIQYYDENTEDDETATIVEKYTEKDEFNIDEMYDSINMPKVDGNIENSLRNNYAESIILKNSKIENKKKVKSMVRQLDRLRNMFKDIDYKLCIRYKKYFSCITRDGEGVDTYTVLKYLGVDNYSMTVVFNLEMLLDDININEDSIDIYNHIHRVLSKNSESNYEKFRELVNEVNTKSINNINNYDKIKSLEHQLEGITNEKKDIENGIYKLKKVNHDSVTGDIKNSKKIEKENKKIRTLNNKCTQILEEIIELKTQQDDKLVRSDQIFFDNSVMLNQILDNLKKI